MGNILQLQFKHLSHKNSVDSGLFSLRNTLQPVFYTDVVAHVLSHTPGSTWLVLCSLPLSVKLSAYFRARTELTGLQVNFIQCKAASELWQEFKELYVLLRHWNWTGPKAPLLPRTITTTTSSYNVDRTCVDCRLFTHHCVKVNARGQTSMPGVMCDVLVSRNN